MKKPKIRYLLEKTSILPDICRNCTNEDNKTFKKEESTEILKVLGLFENI